MSATESAVESSQCTGTNSEPTNEQSIPMSGNEQNSTGFKRSEKLRHVFPRPSRRSIHSRGSSSRVIKIGHHSSALLYKRQLKSRGTFHRVINSFFGNNPERGAQCTSLQTQSGASGSGSQLGSFVHGSVPSIDVISPGTFLFSGPYLHSAGSRNSTPRPPSLSESSRASHATYRTRSNSYFMVGAGGAEDDLLEPMLGQGVVRSMSNVLFGIHTPIEELGDRLSAGHNDVVDFANASHLQADDAVVEASWIQGTYNAEALLQFPSIVALILHYADTKTRRILRLAGKFWYEAVDCLGASSVYPASCWLPTEILLKIYSYLSAKDFNACRRACRSWMLASLDEALLIAMLHRGGWHSGSPAKDDALASRQRITASSYEWRLSRYLSRQCALTASWTGNGMDNRPALQEGIAIDFSDLANGYSLHQSRSSGALIFTSSICAKYLLVAKDTIIYIYHMEVGHLVPVSCVVCPRRVLALDMNASADRNAVATLLEGRMGMVCELQFCHLSVGETSIECNGKQSQQGIRPSTPTGPNDGPQDGMRTAAHSSVKEPRTIAGVRSMQTTSFDAIELKTNEHKVDLQNTDDATTHDRNMINQTWNLALHGPPGHALRTKDARPPMQSIPIESGISTFYRHLCSEDDPPRNVSICPQRRCVAFGCSAGIELHWIDALTGQSLSRWFPLTSSSDHLFFLSPRPGFESAKKLRLISSAAHPDSRPATSRRLFRSATNRPFWGALGFESRSLQPQSCDHYQAIPLSDGHHVLFIDPSTDKLMIGCDAPLGGPARLLRKVILKSPEGQGVPRVYAAAADMSSGARIVVVYGDTIMLYSIPPDVLALSRLEQVTDDPDIYNTPPFSSTGRQHDHWLNWWDQTPILRPANWFEGGSDSPIWPLLLHGTEIGTLPDVCELAVQTHPDILIWAFTYTSQCKTWRLRNHVDPVVRSKQYVDRDGLVHEDYTVDEARDVIMHDAPSSSIASNAVGSHVVDPSNGTVPPTAGFDGNASGVLKRMPRALAVENDEWVDTVDIAGCADAWFEGDGDIVTWIEI